MSRRRSLLLTVALFSPLFAFAANGCFAAAPSAQNSASSARTLTVVLCPFVPSFGAFKDEVTRNVAGGGVRRNYQQRHAEAVGVAAAPLRAWIAGSVSRVGVFLPRNPRVDMVVPAAPIVPDHQERPYAMRRGRFIPIAAVVLLLTVVPAAWAATRYKILHTFTGGKDGGLVGSGVALDAGGNPYGMTYYGGTGTGCSGDGGCGVIFRLSPQAGGHWKEKALFDLTKETGGANYGAGLLFNSSGNLFGSTGAQYPGGPSYIFELTPGNGEWNFSPIYEPSGYCLVFDQAGSLYGCIGPSTGFAELSPGSGGWIYTDIWDDPCNGTCPDGAGGTAPLTWDEKGNLYGTMLFGGNYPPKCHGEGGCGTAFQMTPNGDGTWTYHVLHRFAATETDGYYPYAGLTVDAFGNAYGLTSEGGKYGTGTFFKLTPAKSGLWKETILYEFPNCLDGCVPSFTLVSDQAGNLYSSGGGGLDCGGTSCGTVFKFSPQKNGSWKYSVVHKFDGNDGAFPYGVVLDSKGNIFGTTMQGGKYNMGVAFEITP
jgi:hypothetical protein